MIDKKILPQLYSFSQITGTTLGFLKSINLILHGLSGHENYKM